MPQSISAIEKSIFAKLPKMTKILVCMRCIKRTRIMSPPKVELEPYGQPIILKCSKQVLPYSAASVERFLEASYSSRVTTSSMRRLMPAISSPVMALRRSTTRSLTSSKIAGA